MAAPRLAPQQVYPPDRGSPFDLRRPDAGGPLAKVAHEHDTRTSRVLEHHVGATLSGLDLSGAAKVSVAESSARGRQKKPEPRLDLHKPQAPEGHVHHLRA